MIKLEGITKSFGSLQVLKGIDLEINKRAKLAVQRAPGMSFFPQGHACLYLPSARIVSMCHHTGVLKPFY